MSTINRPRRPWEGKPVEYNKLPGQGRKFGGNQEFYKSAAWRKVRDLGLRMEPFCRECARKGKQTLATVRDHIRQINPINAYDTLNGIYPHPLDMENHQSLCTKCHNRKSAKEAHKK